MNKKRDYEIKGRVIEKREGRGIPNLRVEAWDKDLVIDDLLGSAKTVKDGSFTLSFDETYYQEICFDRRPDVYFKVFLGDREIHSTEDEVIWNLEHAEKEIIIEIDLTSLLPDEDESRFIVSGYVRTTESIPVPEIAVEAFDRKVGQTTPLGREKTNDDGFYRIDYSSQLENMVGIEQVDLFVQCYDQEGEMLDKSDLLINAPKSATINLTVPKEMRRAPTVYEKLKERIGALIQGSNPADLQAEDLEYIAARQELDITEVERFVHALVLAQQASQYETHPGIPAEVFYALIGDEELPDLESLVNKNTSSLKHSLQEAVDKDIIPFELGEGIDQFVAALKEIAVAIAVEEPEDSIAYSLRNQIDILDTVPQELRDDFIRDYTLNEQGDAKFWEELKKNEKFGEHVRSIQDLFTLAELTQKNLPLIRSLYRKSERIDEFAKWRIQDWQDYLRDNELPLPQDGREFTPEQYAQTLAQDFKRRFPMVDLIDGLERSQVLTGENRPSDALKDFLGAHPDLDLGKIPVNRYLRRPHIKEQFEQELEAAEDEEQREQIKQQQDALIKELRDVQLAHALAPSTDHNACVAALRAFELEKPRYPAPQPVSEQGQEEESQREGDRAETESVPEIADRNTVGFFSKLQELARKRSQKTIESQTEPTPVRKIKADSVLKITSMNKADFFTAWQQLREKDGATDSVVLRGEAEEIYNRARYQAFGFAVNAWNVAAPLSSITPAFVPNTYTNIQAQLPDISSDTALTIANLTTLFGNQHYCECRHCQSIYGPAAYLVQLHDSLSEKARGVLFRGRCPDIQGLHLNCENTNTKLPYIDLVIEQLERLVLIWESQLILSKGEPHYLRMNLQTTLSEKELALRPEHELSDAYVVLASLPYPISIPWDKWFEEARLYLDYMDLPLWRLVEVFIPAFSNTIEFEGREDDRVLHSSYRKTQLNSEQCVRALLGLSVPLYDLISKPLTGDDAPETFIHELDDFNLIFGYFGDDLDRVENLTDFVGRLGLWQKNEEGKTGKEDFRLFRRILGSRYIQDSRDRSDLIIDIAFDKDNPCDPSQARITNYNWDTIIRVTKFEHLRRTLGWTPAELNQAIVVFSRFELESIARLETGAINERLLAQISHLVRLQEKIAGFSVTELLSWWGPMDTGAWMRTISPTYEGEEKEPEQISLYEKVFLDKSLYGKRSEDPQDNSEWNYFILNSKKTELAYLHNGAGPEETNDHQSIVCAALQLGENELLELIEFLGSGSDGSFNLTLDNLSALYRVVSLTRYLDISIHEFILLRKFMGDELDPFNLDQDEDVKSEITLIFIECVEKIKRSPFEIRELGYLWQHHTESDEELDYVYKRLDEYLLQLKNGLAEERKEDSTPIQSNAISTADITNTLGQIGLHKINVSRVESIINDGPLNNSADNEFIERTFNFLTSSQIDDLKDILINNRHTGFPNEVDIFSITEKTLERLELEGVPDDVRDKLEALVGEDFTGENVFIDRVASILENEEIDEYQPIITKHADKSLLRILSYLTPIFRLSLFISQELASFLDAPQEVLRKLLSVVMNNTENNGALLLDFVNWDDSSITNAEIRDHLLRLEKIASIVNQWGFTAEEVEYIQWYPRNQFDWNSIPISHNDQPVYRKWASLAEYVEVRNRLSLRKGELLQLFADADDPADGTEILLKRLGALLNLEHSEIELIANELGYFQEYIGDVSTPSLKMDALRNAESLTPVIDIAEAIKRCGRSFEVVRSWVSEEAIVLEAGIITGRVGNGTPDTDAGVNTGRPGVVVPDSGGVGSGRVGGIVPGPGGVIEHEETYTVSLDESFLSNVNLQGYRDALLQYKSTVVEEIRNTVKARCSESQWQEVARNLQDQMRVLQRDKLLDFVIAWFLRPGPDRGFIRFDKPEDVYDFLLIDPLVNPCMNTTRLKLAISSVQLFIHRILMGLERDQEEEPLMNEVETTVLADEWKWKKNYRVWEAQQKVFIYPENWIEPELRDNKTPFFEEFESELSQSEIDEKSIEKAYINYLKKVDEVGHLEVASFKEEVILDNNGEEIGKELHVIGRTREKPRTYYYRKRNNNNIWLPWERINLDIDSEVVLLTVYNGLPYLFWPTLKERIQKLNPDEDAPDNEEENHLPYVEIRFNWSCMMDGTWSSRKKTEEYLIWMYDWEYQKLFKNPEELLRYKIIHVQNTDELSITMNVLADMGEEATEEIEEYDYDKDRVDGFFDDLLKVISKIDWDAIGERGTDFDNVEEDVIGELEEAITTARDDVETCLVDEHNIQGACQALDTLADAFHKKFFQTTDAGMAICAYANKYGIPAEDGGGALDGLNKDDITSVFKLFKDNSIAFYEEISLVQTSRNPCYYPVGWFPLPLLDIRDDFFRYQEELIELEYRYTKTTKRDLSSNNLYRFAKMEFVGYKLKAEAKNSLGNILFGKTINENYDDHKDVRFSPSGKYILSDYYITRYLIARWEFSNNALELHYNTLRFDITRRDPDRSVTLFLPDSGPGTIVPYDTDEFSIFFYQDARYCYLIEDKHEELFECTEFCNPFIKSMIKSHFTNTYDANDELFAATLGISIQNESRDLPYEFMDKCVVQGSEDNHIKRPPFNLTEPFGIYNWEIFFHMPFTIAVRLSQQKKFAEAQEWFLYIFNPLASLSLDDGEEYDEARKYWNFLPLHKLGQPFSDIDRLKLLSFSGADDEGYHDLADRIQNSIHELAKDPFQPHRVARMYKGAYQKAVVMKYLDNLIEWGDTLFAQDTIESINEATHLYILAAKILGPRPRLVPRPKRRGGDDGSTVQDVASYSEGMVVAEYETMAVTVEQFPSIAYDTLPAEMGQILAMQWFQGSPAEADGSEEPPSTLDERPVFCVPHNGKLLSYWDTVADRLFKVRNCMNIEGVVRELPIFEPPIDPGLLVRGQALGIDISELLSDLYAPLPPYRFRVVLQKAYEFCGDVQKLGGALLSALEKRDAEELSLIRSKHERQLLKLTESIKKQQIKELRENLKSLQVSLEMAESRFEYYNSRKFENQNEKAQVSKLDTANVFNIASQAVSVSASVGYLMPQIHAGMGPPTTEQGGKNVGDSLTGVSRFLSMIASIYSHEANMHSIQGSRERRMDDWKFQARQASKEIKQIEKQLLAAEIRLDIAEKELENHQKQQEQAEEIETFMKSKFTNKELYHWMVSQISGIYFQTYRMAVGLAKTAQRCYRHELGDDAVSFIGAAHWDNLKKGLLAGEKLQFDLRRMENAYLEQNKREYELTKHVSLAMLDPVALLMLKETGECYVNLPEAIFDLDYPGHYMRRIKAVSLTIPCVTGPYTNVNCTLTLQSNRIRKNTDTSPEYAWGDDYDDGRFLYDVCGIQAISTSSARDDSGLFELNFHDERYLPFEGAGAISTWHIELPNEFRQFDYDTISDVVIHVRYTARDGGPAFKTIVEGGLTDALTDMILEASRVGLYRLFSVKQEFPSEWHRFMHPAVGQPGKMNLELKEDRFPLMFQDKSLQVNELTLFVKLKDVSDYDSGDPLILAITPPEAQQSANVTLESQDSILAGFPQASLTPELGIWCVEITQANMGTLPDGLKLVQEIDGTTHYRLNPDAIEDIGILCHYSVTG